MAVGVSIEDDNVIKRRHSEMRSSQRCLSDPKRAHGGEMQNMTRLRQCSVEAHTSKMGQRGQFRHLAIVTKKGNGTRSGRSAYRNLKNAGSRESELQKPLNLKVIEFQFLKTSESLFAIIPSGYQPGYIHLRHVKKK